MTTNSAANDAWAAVEMDHTRAGRTAESTEIPAQFPVLLLSLDEHTCFNTASALTEGMIYDKRSLRVSEALELARLSAVIGVSILTRGSGKSI